MTCADFSQQATSTHEIDLFHKQNFSYEKHFLFNDLHHGHYPDLVPERGPGT